MTLIAYPLTYMSTKNLSEDVKVRINDLKYYQAEHAKLETKFQEEMLTLENKYLELYRPLYEIRSKIVRGEREQLKRKFRPEPNLMRKNKKLLEYEKFIKRR